jgi:nucleoside-diphosphate-sugar epimerase
MKRILVTGSSGFIGRHAVAELARRGYEIQVFSMRNFDLREIPRLYDIISRFRPTHLAHFAWFGEHGKVWNSRENLHCADASERLFRAFIENGGQHAFFAGSCAEYDWKNELLSEEKTSTDSVSVYGESKNVLREYIFDLARNRQVKIAWGRIFFVYGPGEHPDRLAPSILQPLLRNESATVRFGNHVRDFLHVEDVARAAAHLLDNDFHGAVNIASGEAITLAEFGKRLAKIAGRESQLKIENGEPTPDNPRVLKADVTRLRSKGFVPQYSLEEGLKTLIESAK